MSDLLRYSSQFPIHGDSVKTATIANFNFNFNFYFYFSFMFYFFACFTILMLMRTNVRNAVIIISLSSQNDSAHASQLL